MSKIKHWDEVTQSWVIDGASNAANIELTNPGYLDENGDSISVDLGFTKVDNRINKLERNVAWIYLNGAIGGGGGGGGGGGIDSTEYTISVEEGNRVYTAGNSIKIHITINGGSLRKTFLVDITNASTGEKLASPVVTGLTRTEIIINNIKEGLQTLKISAHTGLYYASDFILTVIGGAIKLSRIRITDANIYPTSVVSEPVFRVTNSTDSNLLVKVSYTTDSVNYIDLAEKTVEQEQFNIPEISNFLMEKAQTDIGETYTFRVYALGVLNDNILQSNAIEWSTTIILPNTLYILTYGVNKSVPENEGGLEILNKFVYGQYVQFWYLLSFTDSRYPIYDVQYEVSPCYFEQGVLVSRSDLGFSGTVTRVSKDVLQPFSFSTASLPNDTIYDTALNMYKFIKVVLTATSTDKDTITDTKTLYFTLSKPVEKFITATNFDKSLICYYSPVMGVPTGNVTTWRYDNLNTIFLYSRQGIVLLRYIDLIGYNLNGIRNGYSSQGIHLTGKSYALLGTNLFSAHSNEVNLITGTSGFTISTTFRTNANIDNNAVVLSLGKYEGELMTAGIEIIATLVRVYVNKLVTSLNITKGDLVTIDIVFEKYVGVGDSNDSPNHWFVKIFLNGVLSSLGSYTNSVFTSNVENTAWYFDSLLCLGAHVEEDDVISSADVHFYDFKVYSTSLSDNEIIQNYISANIYAELDNGENPSTTKLNELLSNNFISINTEGEFESLLFDLNDPKSYKDDDTLLSTLRAALADSKIPYPIVVINQQTVDGNFLGITLALFSEDLKEIITSEDYRYPINIDYYTMGNSSATRILNSDKMKISIQGTSSLLFVSKNYEIYMGTDEEGKDVLVQMREDWLPENEFTLKADVMDSAHVNNVLIGRIINGMVSTVDQQGNLVSIKPLSNTPPMNINNEWSSKIKHTSEGYPVILFINFRNSNGVICKCLGIYNFNLGRAASFNLGLKMLSDCVFVDNAVTYPRMVESYTLNLTISNGAPVYSIEIGENNLQIGAFDLDAPDVLTSGIFDTIYYSDGSATLHLLRLLTFLSGFGANVLNPKKVLINNLWCTPKLVKNGNVWETNGQYYFPENNANYVQSTLELHMNWNNMIAYYMIAIIFGLVDSMGKNLTLRTWNQVPDENGIPQCVWYMCFYDMDTAMRLDNDGNETVPYNAHIHRYYTETPPNGTSQSKVSLHSDTIPGQFTLVYSAYNTRLLEIAENLREVAKTLSNIYVDLRTTLFPNPGEFIDNYYTGQINLIGAALYNYDYKLKYLQTKKSYSVATGELLSSNDYNQISYLHGNGTTNIKSWFKKRVRFLDGIYGVRENGTSLLDTSVLDVTLSEIWSNNQITKSSGDPDYLLITLASESLTFINISAGESAKATLWLTEVPTNYTIPNVSGTQRLSIYGNLVITLFNGFERFRWLALNDITLPLIRSLSLEGAKNINADAFFGSQSTTGLESLRTLNLRGLLLNRDSLIIYLGITFTLNLPNLEWIDVSNSSINSVSLPLSGVLKYINLSNTRISVLEFDGQPMLETIILDGCNYLQSINLRNCPKVKSLTIPNSVRTLTLENCPGLESLICTYYGRETSLLSNINISACDGLKIINLSGLNNRELSVNALGAYNLEQLILNNTVTTDIILASNLSSLKVIDLSRTTIGSLNFGGVTSSILDLSALTNLEAIILLQNSSVSEIHCPNIQNKFIELLGSCLSDCSNLSRLIGNFKITGSLVFLNCAKLVLNLDYSRVVYTDPYIPGLFCNITFDDTLTSYSEMFANCSSLTGLDFRYIMVRLKPIVGSLNKMFFRCTSLSVNLWSDLFNKCPNVMDITSFCENTGISGAFYSSKDEQKGILEYLPNLLIANHAFSSTKIEWIDNNAFKHTNVITLANYMFLNCTLLRSCEDTWNPSDGFLHSKDFFLNLTHLTNIVPDGMFSNCLQVKMTIDSEETEQGIMFDYLFHYPISVNTDSIYMLSSSLYDGVLLHGTLHVNVFGGLQREFNGFKIPEYTVINSPLAYSSGGIHADLNTFGDLFRNMNPTTLINVLRGIDFNLGETNTIPDDIFENCSNLLNVSGFFSNPTINNNGLDYIFPSPLLFRDCTRLQNVSYLFQSDHDLNIRLIGNGFINNPIVNMDGMLEGSGVFGVIPYKFLRTSGKTINTLKGIFNKCFKLGYTKDRTLNIGTTYVSLGTSTAKTVWDDAVIDNPGTPVIFLLDYSSLLDIDEYYMDGRDWPESWKSLDIYDSRITEYAGENYMIPADLFYSCSPSCTLMDSLSGLSYTKHILSLDDNGMVSKYNGDSDGLKGRLPLKLFKPLSENTKLDNVFLLLNFYPFTKFDIDGYINGRTSLECRGMLLPPDLFSYTPNIVSLYSTFAELNIPNGVDVNLNLHYLPNLESVRSLMYCCKFNDSASDGSILKTEDMNVFYPLVATNTFWANSKLKDISSLFASRVGASSLGLKHIEADMFKPGGESPLHPYLQNVSMAFYKNVLLLGTIPTMSGGQFITSWAGYIEDVAYSNIYNAEAFKSAHSDQSWWPTSWRDY